MSQHWKYAVYLARHKWFVFMAGLRVGAPLWRLIVHDWSKFLLCEWLPYARYFYGNRKWYEWVDSTGKYLPGFTGRGLQQLKGEFDAAWLHHVASEIEQLLEQVEKASETSTLRDEADKEFIDALVCRVHRESITSESGAARPTEGEGK